MLNLNWLRVEEVSWQWSVGRVTVPRLSTWYDVTWYDMTWHDGARYVTWRDIYVIWHDVDMTWHDGTEVHDVTWRDMTWHDATWRDMTRHDATWRDMTRRYATWRDMTCDPYLNARRMNWWLRYCQKTIKTFLGLKLFYRRFIISAPASIKPKSVQYTDFVTQLGKCISAVPKPFRMKFSRNVEKLFP